MLEPIKRLIKTHQLVINKKKKRKLTSRGGHHELVEGEALATGLGDSGSGALGEPEGSHGHLWHIKKSIVISHSGNADHDSVLALEELGNFGDRNWWSIHSGRDESSEHGPGEGGVSPS